MGVCTLENQSLHQLLSPRTWKLVKRDRGSCSPRSKGCKLTGELLVQICFRRLNKLETNVQKWWRRLGCFRTGHISFFLISSIFFNFIHWLVPPHQWWVFPTLFAGLQSSTDTSRTVFHQSTRPVLIHSSWQITIYHHNCTALSKQTGKGHFRKYKQHVILQMKQRAIL